jgi:hypothetical protein
VLKNWLIPSDSLLSAFHIGWLLDLVRSSRLSMTSTPAGQSAGHLIIQLFVLFLTIDNLEFSKQI